MARRALISATLILLALATNVLAQSPPSSISCMNSIAGLTPCMGFLTGGYRAAAPGCCSAFAKVAVGSASCLCKFLGMNNLFGFPFNQTRALVLSGLCNVYTPLVSQCTAAGSPLAPPVAIPPDSSSTGVVPYSPPPSTTGNGSAITNVASQAPSLFTTVGIGLVGAVFAAYICM